MQKPQRVPSLGHAILIQRTPRQAPAGSRRQSAKPPPPRPPAASVRQRRQCNQNQPTFSCGDWCRQIGGWCRQIGGCPPSGGFRLPTGHRRHRSCDRPFGSSSSRSS
eukprot:3590046-Prymnesium_polylepis.1